MDNKTRYQKFKDCFYCVPNWAFLALIVAFGVNEHLFYVRMCEQMEQARLQLDELLEKYKQGTQTGSQTQNSDSQ